MRPQRIVDLFAGPRGWSEGLGLLGLVDVGVELDPWACATARAAGHATIQADVEQLHPDGRADGFLASPPCPAFSTGGKGTGVAVLDDLADAARAGKLRPDLPTEVRLVLEPLRWLEALRPRWIALEQVPSVLPVWEGYAAWLGDRGYSTWTGTLVAADYGVPQTRKRAILMASQDHRVARPEPTHSRVPSLLTEGWVTMEQALGWRGLLDRRNQDRSGAVPPVSTDRPSPTLTGMACEQQWLVCEPDRPPRQVTHQEGLVIQSFRPDYPVQGPTKKTRSAQIGNAVPPLLAAHVGAMAAGLEPPG